MFILILTSTASLAADGTVALPDFPAHQITAGERQLLEDVSIFCTLSASMKCTFELVVDTLTPHTAVVVTSSVCEDTNRLKCPMVMTTRYSVDDAGPFARCAETGHDCEINIFPWPLGRTPTASLTLRNFLNAYTEPEFTSWAWSSAYGISDP